MTKELELTATTHMLTSLEPDGHLVMLLDSFNQETLKSFELGKGLVNHDHVKTKKKQQACSSTACRQTNNKQKKNNCSLTRQDCKKVSLGMTSAHSKSLSKKTSTTTLATIA